MKNTLKIDFNTRQIIMDRTFAKFAKDTMTTEYAHLQQVRNDYPTFEVVLRKIKANSKKKTYNGLTYDYMEDYILTHRDEKIRKSNYREFSEMRLIAECHSKAFRYPVIKSWFLEKYPEIAEFGMPMENIVVSKEKDAQEKAQINEAPVQTIAA